MPAMGAEICHGVTENTENFPVIPACAGMTENTEISFLWASVSLC